MLSATVNDATCARGYSGVMSDLGKRITEMREAKNLSKEQLAEAVGVTRAAVWQWEHGTIANIKLPTFFLLSDILDVDPRWLALGHSDRIAPPLRGFPTSDSGRFRLRARKP